MLLLMCLFRTEHKLDKMDQIKIKQHSCEYVIVNQYFCENLFD